MSNSSSFLRRNPDKDKKINKIFKKNSLRIAGHSSAVLCSNSSFTEAVYVVYGFFACISVVLVGIIFLALELLLPGWIFFGLGAWSVALLLPLVPMSLAVQLLVFLGASLLLLLIAAILCQKIFLGRTLDRDAMDRNQPLEGTGEVIEDIVPPALGKIKCSGSFWQATADCSRW